MYRLLVAEFAIRRGSPADAVTNYLEVARETRHPELAQRAAAIALYARDNEATLEAAQLWAETDPDDMEARQIIVAMHVRARDAERAFASLEDLLGRDAANAEANLRSMANFLSREPDRDIALVVLRRLADKRPEYIPAQLAFAVLAIRANQLPEARAVMDRLVAQGQIDAAIAQSYLSVLQQQGEQSGAIAWLERVLAERPEDFELRQIYARLLLDARRFDAALSEYVSLSKAQPEREDIVFTLGLLSLQLNRVEQANGYFNKVLELNHGFTDQAHFYLGQIAESQQATELAVQHYRRVSDTLGTADTYLDAQIRIGMLLAKGGRIAEARAHLHGVRPHNEAQRVELALAEGEILTEQGRPQEAMIVYNAAIDESYNKNLLYARAMLAEKIDRLDILEADLRTIIARDPDDIEALNALGYTLADRTDRVQEAYQLIARALQL
ncbi:MAG: tetratricopeptide repeat protein, partial [Gammaproteobacteria bacterium]|nr:tetratricopeptide repeat protein [Gammaproteobacteria bacterium]